MNTTFYNVRMYHIYKKYVLTLLALLASISLLAQTNANDLTYFEDFDNPGYPINTPAGSYWSFYNEIHPSQDTWNKFIPGDGNAYITVDADISNDTDWIHPFQTLIFGGVAENHRLEVRMKGAVVDGGLVGFLFTYTQEGTIFNEVDIEVVANDSATPSHETLPENDGWTDARFNTWRNANENSARPFTGTKKAIVNQQNEKVSLIDDQFHTYTIDWRADRIDFFIDNVLQETITTNIATGKSEVIFGFRQLPWAGSFNWSGTHTMVIDYLKIEPIEVETFAADDNFITEFNTETVLDVLDNDTANSTIVSFDNTTIQGNLITINNNKLTFTPSTDFVGEDSFTYILEDSEGVQASATVNITVNPRPLEAINDAITVNIGSSNIPIDVLANDFYGAFGENPTHPLTLPGGKTATASNNGAPISVVNGKVHYTAPANFSGVDTFVYTITDANGYADTATVTITVGGNYPAEASNDSFSVDIDTVTNLNILENDMPSDANIVSFDATSVEGYPISINGSLLTYSPFGGYSGIDFFNYTIEDSEGIQSTATVTLIVEKKVVSSGTLSAINDAISLNIGSSNVLINVLANDSFGANGKNSSHPVTLTNGKMSNASKNGGKISVINDQINYSAPLNFTGVDTFTYTITDAKGFAGTATVTITVGGERPAEAFDDSFTVFVDTATNLDLLANDIPVSASITTFDTISAEGFEVTESSSIITYTPSNGFIGQDSFSYTIVDSNGIQSSATVRISVEEQIIESGPISATNDVVTLEPEVSTLTIDVTINDNFGTNGPNASHPLTLTNGKLSTESNMGGSISVLNGKIKYTKPTEFSGTDSFDYTITDAAGFADKATVVININTEPISTEAINDVFSVEIDTATELDVLANDIVNNATITIFDEISSEGFTISKNSNILTYTPSGEFIGQDSFTYTIEDEEGVQSTATVTITVEEVIVQTGPLLAVNDEITVTEGAENIAINVTENDNYGSNGPNLTHPLTLTNGKMSTASDNNGLISVVDGKVNYSTPANFTGTDTFQYTITDGNGFADTAIVTINITSNSSSSKSTTENAFDTLDSNTDLELIKNNYTAYPSPSNGYLKNTLFSKINTKGSLLIFDVTGKVIYKSEINIKKGKNEFELNVDVSPGIKFMKVVSSEIDYGTKKILFR